MAAVVAWWRRLRRGLRQGLGGHPKLILIGCCAVLLSLPVAVLATGWPTTQQRLDRGNIVIMAMRSLC
ncbi:hypothetical protein WBP06_18965 [Novosphingobium sp. BL-8H]|uniref:hypothetical protein n=1 Tax=Novosphingobium sp. BL-8H TaxID=3127640 RepID=UPI003758385D